MKETNAERTTGTIEAWNLILKRHDHPQHHLRQDVFINNHFSILKGRQMAFIDKLAEKSKPKNETARLSKLQEGLGDQKVD